MDDFEFDAEAACQAMEDEMNWQLEEWRNERKEEMLGGMNSEDF